MKSLFDVNGLMFWDQKDIRLRNQMVDHFSQEYIKILKKENKSWDFHQIEAPLLTPRSLINSNYTDKDVWVQENHSTNDERSFLEANIAELNNFLETIPKDDLIGRMGFESKLKDFQERLEKVEAIVEEETLVLRPETTPSSYVYAQHLLISHSGVQPPFCVWQVGKSFRREKDHVTKHMRLKEFYQLEFQCIYTTDTMNDYQEAVLEPVRKMIQEMVGLPARVIPSDRLPSYSKRTMDVEVWVPEENDKKELSLDIPLSMVQPDIDENDDTSFEVTFEIRDTNEMRSKLGEYDAPPPNLYEKGRWMEICSISKRTDFPQKAKFQTKKGIVEKDLEVLELAIGVDRAVYAFNQKHF